MPPMKSDPYREHLRATKAELQAAWENLAFSAQSVAEIPTAEDRRVWTPEELEKIEAFTSRFARFVDLLVHRVLRALDRYELNEPGTLLDVANRAEARGLVVSVDWLRELKDVRNRIAHDYVGHQLADVFAYCLSQLPALKNAFAATCAYIDGLV